MYIIYLSIHLSMYLDRREGKLTQQGMENPLVWAGRWTLFSRLFFQTLFPDSFSRPFFCDFFPTFSDFFRLFPTFFRLFPTFSSLFRLFPASFPTFWRCFSDFFGHHLSQLLCQPSCSIFKSGFSCTFLASVLLHPGPVYILSLQEGWTAFFPVSCFLSPVFWLSLCTLPSCLSALFQLLYIYIYI